jgi:hypothetical protein
MSALETNVFPITNLRTLSSPYRLYRIRGIRPDDPEYHQNLQTLVRKLSYSLRSPVTSIIQDGEPRLVIRDDAANPPSPFPLVRATAYLDRLPDTYTLDYTKSTQETDPIRLRFVQFMLQAPLSSNPQLWQPGSGEPFFEKTAAESFGQISRFAGFAVRAVLTPDGGIGLCVDVKNKFLGTKPLPAHMTRDQFRRWKGRHFIYHYGHQWYDVQAHELSDLNVTELLVRRDGEFVSLLQFIVDASRKPIPQELAQLPHDAAVLHYQNNTGESRAAPLGLCYPVFDTQEPEVQRYHHTTILKPHERREMIHRFVGRFVQNLRFGDQQVTISTHAIQVPRKMFTLPDYRFGGNTIVSVRGTPGAVPATLDTIGRVRAAMLRDKNVGFYSTDPLQRQYLLLPQSVADSWGGQYVRDLRRAVDDLFPQEHPFDPVVVPYNDRKPRTFVEQGAAILDAAKQHCTKGGFASVMVHHVQQATRQHDQLAAMVVRKMRELDVWAAVNHSAIGQECYVLAHRPDGQPYYDIRRDKRSKFSGYIRNVALNKVLLTNERWPFVLASPLHADLIVGMDVKHNTAGFTVVGERGASIRTICRTSSQRERLLSGQVQAHLLDIVTMEARASSQEIRNVTLHRDGRLFDSELAGAKRAMDILRRQGTIASDATLTLLEISKTSPAPFRLFEVTGDTNERPFVDNPQVGTFHVIGSADAYLCATGKAFRRAGTVTPLHVRYVEGTMPFEQCLEDLYDLTALTWTRPEDCTRYPISMKLTDRRLGEDASEFDADALELAVHALEEAE